MVPKEVWLLKSLAPWKWMQILCMGTRWNVPWRYLRNQQDPYLLQDQGCKSVKLLFEKNLELLLEKELLGHWFPRIHLTILSHPDIRRLLQPWSTETLVHLFCFGLITTTKRGKYSNWNVLDYMNVPNAVDLGSVNYICWEWRRENSKNKNQGPFVK